MSELCFIIFIIRKYSLLKLNVRFTIVNYNIISYCTNKSIKLVPFTFAFYIWFDRVVFWSNVDGFPLFSSICKIKHVNQIRDT